MIERKPKRERSRKLSPSIPINRFGKQSILSLSFSFLFLLSSLNPSSLYHHYTFVKTVFEITAKVVKEKEKNEVKRSTFQLVISYLVELVSLSAYGLTLALAYSYSLGNDLIICKCLRPSQSLFLVISLSSLSYNLL